MTTGDREVPDIDKKAEEIVTETLFKLWDGVALPGPRDMVRYAARLALESREREVANARNEALEEAAFMADSPDVWRKHATMGDAIRSLKSPEAK